MTAVDEERLGKLVPMNGLTPAQRGEIAQSAELIEVAAGDTVDTTAGAVDKTLYVLSGELELLSSGTTTATIVAGSERARFALAHSAGLHDTGRAKSDVQLLRVDRAKISTQLILAEAAGRGSPENRTVMVPAGDWSAKLMRSDLFAQIPAANVPSEAIETVALRVASASSASSPKPRRARALPPESAPTRGRSFDTDCTGTLLHNVVVVAGFALPDHDISGRVRA